MKINFDKIIPINKDLRNYQITAKEDIYIAWKTFRTVMFQMPTGTGKTRLFSSIIKDMHEYGAKRREPVKILILAHREELISQISESIGKKYGIAHGKIKSRHDEEHHYPTQIASVQTLYRRIERWIQKDFNVIIIDEAHHVLAKTYRDICNNFPNAKILGVTATPYRLNAEPFPPMFDILVQSKSIYQFIKNGYLSEYEYYSIKPQSSTQQLINSISLDFSGDYEEQEMVNLLDNKKIRANIIETYETYAKGKKGIVYTINKAHNQHVYEVFKDNGYVAALIDSDTTVEKRKEIVQQFKAGDITILCNVNIFSEGFDCPDVEFIQLTRPTLSLAMYLQQVGRGFRTHDNKSKVIFLDNVGLYNRFGLPSTHRDWLYYFEGKHTGIEVVNNGKTMYSMLKEPESEGIEEVELLYDSTNDRTEPEEVRLENLNRKNNITTKTRIRMESYELRQRISELKQEIEVFKKYNKEIPILLQDELTVLTSEYQYFEIENEIIPRLQNVVGGLNTDFEFQQEFNIIIKYSLKNKFELLFNNNVYEATQKFDNQKTQVDLATKKLNKFSSLKSQKNIGDNANPALQQNKKLKATWKEIQEFGAKLIGEGKFTRKELLIMLNEKFPNQHQHNSNMLSSCKNKLWWKTFGNFGGLVEEGKDGKYRFVTDNNAVKNNSRGLKPGDQFEFEIDNNTNSNDSKEKNSIPFSNQPSVIPDKIELKKEIKFGEKKELFTGRKDEIVNFIAKMIDGTHSRKDIYMASVQKFPYNYKMITNMLSECKNKKRWEKYGNFGGLVEVTKTGCYKFVKKY
jgi:superfamily II DNA or RNA helicase